ncbi:hypothetical protein FHW58_000476 [Duganella sp. 1224]|uniref:hypothetical protein n=1 Tax=Duganella sp. 1224 TaxID=2587052 RepID=UPI0015CB74F1|nr:hypothetical protein [Duganella sp. 1224]NYE59324.1 hypothetical protein [Duganella sp. 1224]
MNSKLVACMLACCLGTAAYAQQTSPDPAVKTGDGKTAQAKKTAASDCNNMQGGVDASGGESVEQHSKSAKASANHNCGKHNGKASTPEAAPTTANPNKDPVLK